ncbi:hypothetical protein [Streptomyces sp. NPDC051704]|uniref:hypothetical protein n=1 Tax=Streptomyces sp. NPDC051704 TaxID=3365671 RepID=UPI00379BBC44
MTGRTPRTAGDRPSRRTGTTAPWPRPTPLRLGYLLIGLLFGAAWGVNRGMPVWEHAFRLLAFVKCCLVAAAIPTTVVLRPYTSLADLLVGIGIAAVVALAGPWVHGTFLVRPPGVSGTPGPSSAPGGEER